MGYSCIMFLTYCIFAFSFALVTYWNYYRRLLLEIEGEIPDWGACLGWIGTVTVLFPLKFALYVGHGHETYEEILREVIKNND